MSEPTNEKISDQDPSPTEDRRRSAADLAVEEIQRRTKQHKCSMCDEEKWLVLPISERTSTSVPIVSHGRDFATSADQKQRWRWPLEVIGSIPTCTLVCMHCGFVRQHVLFPESFYLAVSEEDERIYISTKTVVGDDYQEIKLQQREAKRVKAKGHGDET